MWRAGGSCVRSLEQRRESRRKQRRFRHDPAAYLAGVGATVPPATFASLVFFPSTPLLRTAHRSPRRDSLPAGNRPPFAGPPADPALPAPTPRLVPRPAALRPIRGQIGPVLLRRSLPRPTPSHPAPGIGFVRAFLIPSSSSFRAFRAFRGQALPFVPPGIGFVRAFLIPSFSSSVPSVPSVVKVFRFSLAACIFRNSSSVCLSSRASPPGTSAAAPPPGPGRTTPRPPARSPPPPRSPRAPRSAPPAARSARRSPP